jgi:hypothetical protein
MTPDEKIRLVDVLTAALSVYGQVLTPMSTEVWLAALDPFPIAEVSAALSAHIRNPDVGQYPPKPADVVRALNGATGDNAAWAWAKVARAARSVGGYRTVAFDDPGIHAAVEALGGWVWLCEQPERELPFIAKRFEALYGSARARVREQSYPRYLIGRTEAENRSNGHPHLDKVALIGDIRRCAEVIEHGREGPPGTTLMHALQHVAARLGHDA